MAVVAKPRAKMVDRCISAEPAAEFGSEVRTLCLWFDFKEWKRDNILLWVTKNNDVKGKKEFKRLCPRVEL